MTTQDSDDQPRPGERVFYIRDDRGQPIACLAYQADGREVAYALSVLHPNDSFDRAMARRIALGRLRVRPMVRPITADERPLGLALECASRDMSVSPRIRRILTDKIADRRQALEERP